MNHPFGQRAEGVAAPPGRPYMHPMENTLPHYDIELFYDGDCPLCLREINLLRRLDRKSRILFTDIASPSFAAGDYGKTFDDFSKVIHARTEKDGWITGVEVFRRLYGAVGFGFLVRLTRLPLVSGFLDLAYKWFAKNRLRLTGRCGEDDSCRVPDAKTSR